jgi:hypothetical protein
MTMCVVCGQPCVPMADYEYPVCVDCDLWRHDALERLTQVRPQAVHAPPPETPIFPGLQRLAAIVTAETYGRLVPEYHNNRNDELAALQKPQPPLRVIEGGAA